MAALTPKLGIKLLISLSKFEGLLRYNFDKCETNYKSNLNHVTQL